MPGTADRGRGATLVATLAGTDSDRHTEADKQVERIVHGDATRPETSTQRGKSLRTWLAENYDCAAESYLERGMVTRRELQRAAIKRQIKKSRHVDSLDRKAC